MIIGYEKFTYIGYTLSDKLPTLYFKEGHYTQAHKDRDNIGWHPNKVFHRGENISPQRAEEWCNGDIQDLEWLHNFYQEFWEGKYDSTDAQSRYFELHAPNLNVYHRKGHLSRGQLIKQDLLKPVQYSRDYAQEVLKNGQYALCDIRNPIPDCWDKKYLGYIDHANGPALIFEEGYYLPVNKQPQWQGWHPCSNKYFLRRVGISNLKIEDIPFTVSMSGSTLKAVLAGKSEGPNAVDVIILYDGNSVELNPNDRVQFVIVKDKFIKPGDKNFNEKFDDFYAHTVLSNANYAEVCMPLLLTTIDELQTECWLASSFSSLIIASVMNGKLHDLHQKTMHQILTPVIIEFFKNNQALEDKVMAYIHQLDAPWQLNMTGFNASFESIAALIEKDYELVAYCNLTLIPEAMIVLAHQLGLATAKVLEVEGEAASFAVPNLRFSNAIYGLGKMNGAALDWIYVDKNQKHYATGEVLTSDEMVKKFQAEPFGYSKITHIISWS